MACNNCFNGCAEISSDRCIQYTGIDIPFLGIANGDSLSDVEKVLTDKILDLMSGLAILPDIDPQIICKLVSDYLPGCGTFTLVDFINALIKATCNLQLQTTANTEVIAILNSSYAIGCLTGVTSTSGTHDILQAAIIQLCSTASGLTSLSKILSTNYSKNGTELDNYIANYIATHNTGSTKQSNKMVPYVAYEFYGSLSGKFDANGVGLVNSDWAKIYICNGQNGTPDKRGRVAVGATDSPGPAFTNADVNPAISGNPTWSAGTPGAWTLFGTNLITLNTLQMPSHSHGAIGTSLQTEHFHYEFNIDNNAGAGVITSVTYPQTANNDGTAYQYNMKGSNTIPSIGKTNAVTPAITTNVSISSAGSGQGHPNTQPGIAAYYIMYIP